MTVVVADSGPLIHLSMIGQTELLPDLYGQTLVPRAVYREVVEIGHGLPGSAELTNASWAEIVDQEESNPLYELLRAELDPGESAAILLATSREADLLLIDDRSARAAATRLNLRVKGTLGVLVEAKRKSRLKRVAPLLQGLQAQGMWLSPHLVDTVLRSVGES